MAAGRNNSLVVVANRLPVERVDADNGAPNGSRPPNAPHTPNAPHALHALHAPHAEWRPSPGGLVSALAPILEGSGGTWIGWSGSPDERIEPFESGGFKLVPVDVTSDEIAEYYEGFSNSTLWPLYHDITGRPIFERRWWESYVEVNQRFADVAAAACRAGSTVWVHDYQLQLVPAMLRRSRPDLRIGWFNHIPFPGYEIYSRLPWRSQVIEGLLGADLLGFQRHDDAANFLRAARGHTDATTRGSVIDVGGRRVRAGAFPISIDSVALDQLSRSNETLKRAERIREDLGNPAVVLLGVDRLDYTKGILHRLRAFGELLDEGLLRPPQAALIQVASPSRERVGEYQRLRQEVETVVGRINGDHGHVGRPAVHYLHQSFPRSEMAALYLAADVMLVTPLRDGMNLVAKEYVACRHDERGALVLSEFTGAADELRQAYLVNPWDIDGTKDAIAKAATLAPADAARRMRAMRRRVFEDDVHHWAAAFLGGLEMAAEDRREPRS